jgi:predicted NBD/HSP70 family sugar kinase
MRRANRRLIFHTILEMAPVSRAALAARLGLSTTAVADLVAELLEYDVVCESGIGRSVGGRRPTLLAAGSRSLCVLGIEIGPERVGALVSDPAGTVLGEASMPCRGDATPETILADAIRVGREALSGSGGTLRLAAIGVACSGPVDANGRLVSPDMPGWSEMSVDVAGAVSEAFGAPAVIDNDANLGSLGELRFGLGRHHRHLVYILVHRGVGAGIIADGSVYGGEANRAGELGHTVFDLSGTEKCACGSFGCLETFVSTQALVRYWAEGVKLGRPTELSEQVADIDADAVIAAAHRGDRAARAAVERLGELLGVTFANVANLFGPELVVLGGPLTHAGRLLLEPARAIANSRTRTLLGESVSFEFSELGSRGPLFGAVAFALDGFITDADSVAPSIPVNY